MLLCCHQCCFSSWCRWALQTQHAILWIIMKQPAAVKKTLPGPSCSEYIWADFLDQSVMCLVLKLSKTYFIFVTTVLARTQQPEVWQRNTCVLFLLDITPDRDTLLYTSLNRSNYQAPSVPEDPLDLFHQVVPESQSSQVIHPPPLNQSDQVLQVAPTWRTAYVTNYGY